MALLRHGAEVEAAPLVPVAEVGRMQLRTAKKGIARLKGSYDSLPPCQPSGALTQPPAPPSPLLLPRLLSLMMERPSGCCEPRLRPLCCMAASTSSTYVHVYVYNVRAYTWLPRQPRPPIISSLEARPPTCTMLRVAAANWNSNGYCYR